MVHKCPQPFTDLNIKSSADHDWLSKLYEWLVINTGDFIYFSWDIGAKSCVCIQSSPSKGD